MSWQGTFAVILGSKSESITYKYTHANRSGHKRRGRCESTGCFGYQAAGCHGNTTSTLPAPRAPADSAMRRHSAPLPQGYLRLYRSASLAIVVGKVLRNGCARPDLSHMQTAPLGKGWRSTGCAIACRVSLGRGEAAAVRVWPAPQHRVRRLRRKHGQEVGGHQLLLKTEVDSICAHQCCISTQSEFCQQFCSRWFLFKRRVFSAPALTLWF